MNTNYMNADTPSAENQESPKPQGEKSKYKYLRRLAKALIIIIPILSPIISAILVEDLYVSQTVTCIVSLLVGLIFPVFLFLNSRSIDIKIAILISICATILSFVFALANVIGSLPIILLAILNIYGFSIMAKNSEIASETRTYFIILAILSAVEACGSFLFWQCFANHIEISDSAVPILSTFLSIFNIVLWFKVLDAPIFFTEKSTSATAEECDSPYKALNPLNREFMGSFVALLLGCGLILLLVHLLS